MRGHLQCRDTLAGNEGCPLKTGTTVLLLALLIDNETENVCYVKKNRSRVRTAGLPDQLLLYLSTNMNWH